MTMATGDKFAWQLDVLLHNVEIERNWDRESILRDIERILELRGYRGEITNPPERRLA